MELTLTRQTPAQHIVWLDVVRLVAMFTVVCCHCTDPFNFYPGTSPDIVDIKFWGAVYGAALRPCVPLFVMITGILQETYPPRILSFPHLVCDLQSVPLDNGTAGSGAESDSGFLPLFG